MRRVTDLLLYVLILPRVIARISVEVTTPPPERKFDGIFQIVTEFSPMASPAFEVGRYVSCNLTCTASSDP